MDEVECKRRLTVGVVMPLLLEHIMIQCQVPEALLSANLYAMMQRHIIQGQAWRLLLSANPCAMKQRRILQGQGRKETAIKSHVQD